MYISTNTATPFGRAKILGKPRYSTELMAQAGSLPYMGPELISEEVHRKVLLL